jgi:uncharacterized protein (TIGR02246 family)
VSSSVTETLDRLSAAWNAGDAAAYAAEFTEDATYVIWNGTVLHGRTAVEDTHRWLFAGPLKGSRFAEQSEAPVVRFVRPDVAHVIASGGITPDGQDELPDERASTVSFLLEETAEGWKVAAFQNTRVQQR